MIGFANKGNAKRTLENNFTKDEDYKITILPTEKGQIAREDIMLNVDTFKNLCMIAKTSQGKEMRKYYVKMENIYNKIIKEEIENQKNLLEEKESLLKEKDYLINELENKPEMDGFYRKNGGVYLIKDNDKKGHYKIGVADDNRSRLKDLNTGSSTRSLETIFVYETYDKFFAEKMIHYALNPFKISSAKEWFYLKNDLELAYSINTIKDCINYINKYDFVDYNSFKNHANTLCINDELKDLEKQVEIKKQHTQKNNLINKTIVQQMSNKTGNYKGVFWIKSKNKWRSELKRDYKNIFLGYYDNEIDGAKAYNNYAKYLNENFDDSNYSLNDIPDYITVPINIPKENKVPITETDTSNVNEVNELITKINYTGVQYDPKRKNYNSAIKFSNKNLYLGCSKDPIEAAKLYNQQAAYLNKHKDTKYILNDIPGYIIIEKDVYSEKQTNKKISTTSKYFGVSFNKTRNKWRAFYVLNKKQTHIGSFDTELEAAEAYNKVVTELNKDDLCNYKLTCFFKLKFEKQVN